MRYFFVKIGSGNGYAAALLDEKLLGHPAIVGFFRSVTTAEVAARVDDDSVRFSRQAIDLYRWSTGSLSGYGICVGSGTVWILEPAGEMYDVDRSLFEEQVGPTIHADDIPKAVPVRVIYREMVPYVPSLVAQITSNRHLSSSTFKEITEDFGTRLSIDHVLFKAGIQHQYPTITPGERDLYHLLLCLGGNELIDLVAQILEEYGLSVPAPTGGFVRNIDIVAYNDTPRPITIASIVVPPRHAFRPGAITVQVKGAVQDLRPAPVPEVDYIVQLNAVEMPGVLNERWFAQVLPDAPRTGQRLGRLLRWVPFSGTVLRTLYR